MGDKSHRDYASKAYWKTVGVRLAKENITFIEEAIGDAYLRGWDASRESAFQEAIRYVTWSMQGKGENIVPAAKAVYEDILSTLRTKDMEGSVVDWEPHTPEETVRTDCPNCGNSERKTKFCDDSWHDSSQKLAIDLTDTVRTLPPTRIDIRPQEPTFKMKCADGLHPDFEGNFGLCPACPREKQRVADVPQKHVTSNPEDHARNCEYDGEKWLCGENCPVKLISEKNK